MGAGLATGWGRRGALALTVGVTLGALVVLRPLAGAAGPPSTAKAAPLAAASEDKRDQTLRAVDFSLEPSVDPQADFPGELSRRVLALYDSSETFDEEDDHHQSYARPVDSEVSPAHRLAELPLNYLGLAVDYADVNLPLPDEAQMRRYRGVLIWFNDEKMKEPERYLEWLAAQPAAGRRVVILERLGAYQGLDDRAVSPELVAKALLAVGGTYLGNWSDDPSVIALVKADPKLIGFESPLAARLDFYQQYRADPGTTVHLIIERTDLENSHSDVVWTGPNGGFAAPGYVYSEDRLGERYVMRWVLNPFEFFERAFGTGGWPRFDFTTRNGQRIFYSQIDGDGLDTITELDYKTPCGEYIRDHIFKQYDLPVTASIVVGLTAPPPVGKGSNSLVALARSVLALENVEVASHGIAHPMDWRAGSVKGYSADEPAVRSLPSYPDAGVDVVGRGEIEIAGSVAYIDEFLAPPGKKCRTMLWTGWCNPSEEQLAIAYRLGLRNLNGGDPRMDEHYPSYAHMVPPVRQVGKLKQFLTSAANDYILTDDWTPPFYRFKNVIQTFERTGSPRRVVPVDVYYHFYLARNYAALSGLKTTLDWVVTQPLAPMFTGDYVDIARDFHDARFASAGPRRWTMRKGKALRTVRFDAQVDIDLEASTGVLGYLKAPELSATYVHLDERPEVVIQLGAGPPSRPYLSRATHPVEGLKVDGDTVSFATHTVGPREFVFAGMTPGGRYRVESARLGKVSAPQEVLADAQGRLTFETKGQAGYVDMVVRKAAEAGR